MPLMQFDANCGIPAAVLEMLLFSEPGMIKLLPALPSQWPDGHARGLRARGDYTVDIQWKEGRLLCATIHAGKNAVSETIPVVYANTRTEITLKPGQSVKLSRQDLGMAK